MSKFIRPTREKGDVRIPEESPSICNHDEQVSQTDDEEMARRNIEISAGVAWWLTLAGSDCRRYEDLVARASDGKN